MVLKLFCHPGSSLRVAIVLQEKGVLYEMHLVDPFKGQQRSPEFLEKNPFGMLPYIVRLTFDQDDDGFILFESRAICHYIAAKYADQGTLGLVPIDPKENALFQQAVSFEITSFSENAEKAVMENFFKPMRGMPVNKEAFNKYVDILDAKLDVYEKILSKQKYLAGNNITLADLYHIPYGCMLPLAGAPLLEVKSRSNVARWWKDITSRPSWQAVKGILEDALNVKL